MSEISSGLVAVAHMMQSPDGKCMGFLPFEEEGTAPVVRLSDAEAIISAKNAEILDQCRINGIGGRLRGGAGRPGRWRASQLLAWLQKRKSPAQ